MTGCLAGKSGGGYAWVDKLEAPAGDGGSVGEVAWWRGSGQLVAFGRNPSQCAEERTQLALQYTPPRHPSPLL